MTQLVDAPDISTAGGIADDSIFAIGTAAGDMLYKGTGAALKEYLGGGGGGAMVQLDRVVVTAASQTDIAFDDIDQSYCDLILVMDVLGVNNEAEVVAQLTINGDTGNNYSYYYVNGYGTGNEGGQPAATIGNFGYSGGVTAEIPSYTRNTQIKVIYGRGAWYDDNQNRFEGFATYNKDATVPITSMNLNAGPSQTFSKGTIMTLYGRGTAPTYPA